MKTALNVVFAGTPDFSVPALAALHTWCVQQNHQLTGVLTQPDRPAGRGRKLRQSPVKLWAEAHQIAVYQPQTLRNSASREPLEAWQPDLMIVVAYGLLLPAEVLHLPKYGCLNVHASLLPRWRGAAPIQRAILAGDNLSGVAIMQMDEGLDTGPVWSQHEVPIAKDETGGSLHDKLARSGADVLVNTLPQILNGTAKPVAQSADGVTYAHKLSKQEAGIDWSCSAQEIQTMIRAFDPWPVAHTTLDGRGVRIFSAQTVSAINDRAPPGTIIDVVNGLLVTTGDGVLDLQSLQPAGSRRMDARAFLNAHQCLGQRFI